MLSSAEKIYFWSGIMRDHAEFFLMSLSSRETEMIHKARYFKATFIGIGNEARTMIAAKTTAASFAKSVMTIVNNFIEFKQLALKRLLQCSIELGFPPTFVNHMINEAMEFIGDLNRIQTNAALDPLSENIQIHKIWLPDAAGHAAAIASDLDPTEVFWINEAKDFKNSFEHLYIKAVELGMELERSGLSDGALEWFNMEVIKKLNEFICFLDKIFELREKCMLLGNLSPLYPDHMIREEKYYIANIESFIR